MSDEIAIKVEHVSKNFVLPHEKVSSIKGLFTNVAKKRHGRTIETQHALKDISFEIKKGEFFGIVGRNGSGKSTMLKILAGIYQPTSGRVQTYGKLVPFIELGVGFNPELTGRENVYLNGAMLGFSEAQVKEMYSGIVKFAELEKFMDQKLKNYSSGMQVRLAFSMATRAEADILLVDEVLAVGDADFQRKCFSYFRSLKKNNKTVVFVSHDMGAIREYCDRALLIDESEVQNIGKTSEVSREYSRLFIEQSSSEASAEQKDKDKRWGNGNAKVKNLSLNKTIFTDRDDTLRLTVKVEVFRPDSDLMTGFRIRTAAGQSLHETNTWVANKKMPELQPGETCDVVWELPNLFTDGEYTIDTYVYGEGTVVLDAWDEGIVFTVKRPDAQGFLINIPPSVTIKK
ncbi:MAG: tagH [Candidatus Saccharibacteria bacterium]|nr:tagH [Candidatus Saccharibacteria bacterium]